MSSFTKGPWHWDADFYAVVDGAHRWRYRVVALGRTIMQTYYTEEERGQADADTRLAASAPDLLEACEAAREWLAGWASAEGYIERLDAAIARATGEQP